MTIKNEVGNRIVAIRKEKNLSASDLARLTNFSKARISNWEHGKRLPSLEDAKVLEKALNYSAAYLLGLCDSNLLLTENADFFYKACPHVPLLTKNHFFSPKLPKEHYIPLISSAKKGGQTKSFAYELEDESMEPTFKKNDIVYFNSDILPQHGDFVLIKINNPNQVLFRKYYIDNSKLDLIQIKLMALNPEWPCIESGQEAYFSLLGVMLNHFRVFT